MNQQKTNWIAVIVGIVLAMGLGMLWYGFLFQKQWMAGNGITQVGEKYFKQGVEMPMNPTPMIMNTLAMVLYALLLNWLIHRSQSYTAFKGMMIGGAVGLILLLNTFVSNLFASNPLSLSIVDGSYCLLMFLLLGALFGGWRRK